MSRPDLRPHETDAWLSGEEMTRLHHRHDELTRRTRAQYGMDADDTCWPWAGPSGALECIGLFLILLICAGLCALAVLYLPAL